MNFLWPAFFYLLLFSEGIDLKVLSLPHKMPKMPN